MLKCQDERLRYLATAILIYWMQDVVSKTPLLNWEKMLYPYNSCIRVTWIASHTLVNILVIYELLFLFYSLKTSWVKVPPVDVTHFYLIVFGAFCMFCSMAHTNQLYVGFNNNKHNYIEMCHTHLFYETRRLRLYNSTGVHMSIHKQVIGVSGN